MQLNGVTYMASYITLFKYGHYTGGMSNIPCIVLK